MGRRKSYRSVNIVTSHNMFVFFSRMCEILDIAVNLVCALETVIILESDCSFFLSRRIKKSTIAGMSNHQGCGGAQFTCRQ